MTAENERIVQEFLRMVIARDIDAAYEKYVNMSGKHHNVYFPAGFAALREAMKQNHAQFPDTKLTFKHLIAEGDLVVTHSRVQHKPGDIGVAVVHLFRIANGKIVEMWDCGMEIPRDCPNGDGAF